MISLPFWFFLTGFSAIAAVEKDFSAYRSVRYCFYLLSKHIMHITWGYFKLVFLFSIPLTILTIVYQSRLSIDHFDITMVYVLPFYIIAYGILYPIRTKSLMSYFASLRTANL